MKTVLITVGEDHQTWCIFPIVRSKNKPTCYQGQRSVDTHIYIVMSHLECTCNAKIMVRV